MEDHMANHYKVTVGNHAFYAVLEVVADTREEAESLFRQELASDEWQRAAREEAEISAYADEGLTLEQAVEKHRYDFVSDAIEQENIDPLTSKVEPLDYLPEPHRVPHVVRMTESGGNG
jgi:hypothetical protein